MKNVIYIDVDDTIVRSAGAKRIPITKVISKIKELAQSGNIIYLWSRGGSSYAKDTAVEFEIDKCITGFLPKPNIIIDDQNLIDWKFLKQIHPNEISNMLIDSPGDA